MEKLRACHLKPDLSKLPVKFQGINWVCHFSGKGDIKSDLNKPGVLEDFPPQVSKGELGTTLCKTLGGACDIRVV